MSILSLQNVSKVYGSGPRAVAAISNVSLSAEPGQMIALVGASGSGKTTLLNLAAGLDAASEGTVVLVGRDLAGLNEAALALIRRRQVGFVFQSLNLIATLTASENIQLPLVLSATPTAERLQRVDQLLELAGLADKARAFPDELSAGQQQRIAALRAVAHRPDVVLIDEPTSCLDTTNADKLMELLLDMNRSEGATMILATHDTRVADKLHRTVTLRDGRIVDDRLNPDN